MIPVLVVLWYQELDGGSLRWGMGSFGVRGAVVDLWGAEFSDEAADAADGFAEIDCVRPMLGPGVAEAAEQRAARLGLGADRVLIARQWPLSPGPF